MANVDVDEYDDDLDEEEEESPEEPNLVKQLRGTTRAQKKMIRDLQKQVEENSTAARRLAIMDADLPKNKQIEFFISKYDGPWDTDSLRSAAAEAGFLDVSEEINEEVSSVEGMMNASRGGSQSAAPGSNQDVKDKIAAVKPGPNASKQIAQIMQDHGLFVDDE